MVPTAKEDQGASAVPIKHINTTNFMRRQLRSITIILVVGVVVAIAEVVEVATVEEEQEGVCRCCCIQSFKEELLLKIKVA